MNIRCTMKQLFLKLSKHFSLLFYSCKISNHCYGNILLHPVFALIFFINRIFLLLSYVAVSCYLVYPVSKLSMTIRHCCRLVILSAIPQFIFSQTFLSKCCISASWWLIIFGHQMSVNSITDKPKSKIV